MLLESGLSRLRSKIDKHACGVITAFRGTKTKKENMDNNKKLKTALERAGFTVTPVDGSYLEKQEIDGAVDMKEISEKSFFVANEKVEGDDDGKLEGILRELGQKYDQDSILSIPFSDDKEGRLVWTSKKRDKWWDDDQAVDGEPEVLSAGKLKMGKADGIYYSKIKGRKFEFVPTTKETIEDEEPIAESFFNLLNDINNIVNR